VIYENENCLNMQLFGFRVVTCCETQSLNNNNNNNNNNSEFI